MKTFILLILVASTYLPALSQASRRRGEANVAKYLSSMVGDNPFRQNFILENPLQEDSSIVFSTNSHLFIKLKDYHTFTYAIMDGKEYIQSLPFYTNKRGQVYLTDSEWFGFRKTLMGYNHYYQHSFKVNFTQAIAIARPHLSSKVLERNLRCDCTISAYDVRYNPQVKEGKRGKEIILPYCFEISDSQPQEYPQQSPLFKQSRKHILIDPMNGNIISEQHSVLNTVY